MLTAPQVDTLRKAADNMGDEGGGGDTHHHYNISTMDSADFTRYLKKNPGALSAGISHAARNGHLDVASLARGK